MHLERIQEWLAQLDEHLHHVPDLHPVHARSALALALQPLDELESVVAGTRPPPDLVFVASRTVFTVAIEWCAVWMARGARVTLKSPTGLEDWYAAMAGSTSLPITATSDRAVLGDAAAVVVMGSDATVSAVQRQTRGRVLGFGNRRSIAWWTHAAHADRLARDVLAYDGRGCMSPTAIYTPLPEGAALLAEALQRAKARWPTGVVHSGEAAFMRERSMLAHVAGRRVGDVLQLPAHLESVRPTPGMATLHVVDEPPVFHANTVSCIGTDDEVFDGVRTVELGSMQRPQLDRLHDGVRWTRWPER